MALFLIVDPCCTALHCTALRQEPALNAPSERCCGVPSRESTVEDAENARTRYVCGFLETRTIEATRGLTAGVAPVRCSDFLMIRRWVGN